MALASESHRQVMQVLRQYASEPTARGMLNRALNESQLNGDSLQTRDLPRLFDQLTYGIRLFIEEGQRDRLAKDLAGLLPDEPAQQRQVVRIESEHDARRARIFARALCVDAGAKRLLALKVATGVSELARNILMYAGRGQVEIVLEHTPPRKLRVVASDTGPGIKSLNLILAGTYKSKTGMGRGLLGVKRMSDWFDISTGAEGTQVEFEMFL